MGRTRSSRSTPRGSHRGRGGRAGSIRPPVDRDRDPVAVHVDRGARGVAPEVRDLRRALGRADGEAPVDEQAVERRDARLALRCHGREGNVLRALEVRRDLARGEAALRGDDVRHVPVRACEVRIEHRLELVELRFRLEHGASVNARFRAWLDRPWPRSGSLLSSRHQRLGGSRRPAGSRRRTPRAPARRTPARVRGAAGDPGAGPSPPHAGRQRGGRSRSGWSRARRTSQG